MSRLPERDRPAVGLAEILKKGPGKVTGSELSYAVAVKRGLEFLEFMGQYGHTRTFIESGDRYSMGVVEALEHEGYVTLDYHPSRDKERFLVKVEIEPKGRAYQLMRMLYPKAPR